MTLNKENMSYFEKFDNWNHYQGTIFSYLMDERLNYNLCYKDKEIFSKGLFGDEIDIPNNCKILYIHDSYFNEITFPYGIKKIVIRNCINLRELKIPEGVEEVCVINNNNLIKLLLPNTIKILECRDNNINNLHIPIKNIERLYCDGDIISGKQLFGLLLKDNLYFSIY